jgi:hypothetical protein
MQVPCLFHGTSEQAINSIIHSDTAGFQPLLSVSMYLLDYSIEKVDYGLCA